MIKDAKELKSKRIRPYSGYGRESFPAWGADITPTDDGMIIHGGKPLHGAEIDSYLDHRVAMSSLLPDCSVMDHSLLRGGTV